VSVPRSSGEKCSCNLPYTLPGGKIPPGASLIYNRRPGIFGRDQQSDINEAPARKRLRAGCRAVQVFKVIREVFK
jgi:hypothetical protein